MKSFLFFLLTIVLTIPVVSYAQEVNPNYLVGIPGIEQGKNMDFDSYIQAVYVMFISIAALLAVVKIIIAGVKYMFTDIVPQKTDAKNDIRSALLGLLIIVSAVIILSVINPDLTKFDPNIGPIDDPGPAISTDESELIIESNLGYTYVSTKLSSQQRLKFVTECSGRVVTVSDQIRCYEVDQETVEKITTDLNNLSEDEIEIVVNQVRDFLGNKLITDQTVIDKIMTENDISQALFVVSMPPVGNIPGLNGFPVGYESQVEGICNKYAEANSPTLCFSA
jgi:hypothetical protein